jgi:hypothetical protein
MHPLSKKNKGRLMKIMEHSFVVLLSNQIRLSKIKIFIFEAPSSHMGSGLISIGNKFASLWKHNAELELLVFLKS